MRQTDLWRAEKPRSYLSQNCFELLVKTITAFCNYACIAVLDWIRVDLAPSHRGVPVGPRAAISHSGSRHVVWSSLFAADPCNGHSGPSDRTPIALAKCLR